MKIHPILILVFLLTASILLLGCTEGSISVPPFTFCQLVSKTYLPDGITKADCNMALSGDLNNFVLGVGGLDGNSPQWFNLADINGGTGGSIDWNSITGFPSSCGAGKAIQAIGTTLTCVSIGSGSGSFDLNEVKFVYDDLNKIAVDGNLRIFYGDDGSTAMVNASGTSGVLLNGVLATSGIRVNDYTIGAENSGYVHMNTGIMVDSIADGAAIQSLNASLRKGYRNNGGNPEETYDWDALTLSGGTWTTADGNEICHAGGNCENVSGNFLDLNQTSPQLVYGGIPDFNVGIKTRQLLIGLNSSTYSADIYTANTTPNQTVLGLRSYVDLDPVSTRTAQTTAFANYVNVGTDKDINGAIFGQLVYPIITRTGGTISSIYGYYSSGSLGAGTSGDINKWSNMTLNGVAKNVSSTMTIDNFYGLEIGAISSGTTNWAIYSPYTNSFFGNDYIKAYFGTGNDSYIFYNGNDLVAEPDAVGTGKFKIQGDFKVYDSTPVSEVCNSATGYCSSSERVSIDNVATMYNQVSSSAYYALDFDGTNEFVQVTDNNLLSFGNGTTDSPFSISAWIYMDDATNFTVLTKDTVTGREYVFRTLVSDKLHFYVLDNSTGGYRGRLYNTAITSLQAGWHHVVATYSGNSSNSGIKIYIDNIRRDDTNYEGGTYTAMENLGGDVAIGNQLNGGVYANGRIDEVNLLSKELSVADVNTLYASGAGYYLTPTFGDTVGIWHFDSGIGSTATDSSGNNLTGSLQNMETGDWVTGKVVNTSGVQKIVVWSSQDSPLGDEIGIQNYGDYRGRSVINGSSIRFNIGSNEKMRIDSNGYVAIGGNDTNRPSFPLTIFSTQIGGDGNYLSAWLQGGISATKFITRTEIKEGDQLKEILDANDLFNLDGSINHKAFKDCYYPYPVQVFDYYRIEKQTKDECVVKYKTIKAIDRNVPKIYCSNPNAIDDCVIDGYDIYYMDVEIPYHVCEKVIYDVNVPVYKEVVEDGVDETCVQAKMYQALAQINKAMDINNTEVDMNILFVEEIFTKSKVPNPEINYCKMIADANIYDKAQHYAYKSVGNKLVLDGEYRWVVLEGCEKQKLNEMCLKNKTYSWCK